MNLNVYAAESNKEYSGEIVGQAEVLVDGEITEIPIVVVSEDEMNRLIETGGRVTRNNWFTDFVALTITRDPSNFNRAKIVLMNVGFLFDVVDSVKGSIKFYNSNGQKIIEHQINETDLVYSIARTSHVTALGFTSAYYFLTVPSRTVCLYNGIARR